MKASFWLGNQWLVGFIAAALLAGGILEFWIGNAVDYWIHDAAVVYQARTVWRHTAVVVLDDGVPINVDRKQALPLFAKATERLVDAGAKGVFLDARIPKELEGVMPYAVCIRQDGNVEWSRPACQTTNRQCRIASSALGTAPLKMKPEVFRYFRLAPYLPGQDQLPDFLLYDWEAENVIPPEGINALDRLITKNTPIARWMDMSRNHAVLVMSRLFDAEKAARSEAGFENEVCDQGTPCRRIRLSYPVFSPMTTGDRLVLPVSQLASCDSQISRRAALKAQGKVVILQMTAPTESTDSIITPMSTAWLGPHVLTPGAQYLVDAIETLLNQDHPRPPPAFIKYLVFLLAATLGVGLGAYYPHFYLWISGVGMVAVLGGLCFFMPTMQLWPVTAPMVIFLCGAGETLAAHLIFGFREGHLISQYMPKQIHNLLSGLKKNESFRNRRHRAIVLMSDLAGYSTVTEILNEPGHVLQLMNDYLSETSFVLQDKYQGWLESYIGDMVCYYWPFHSDNQMAAYRNALQGALELSTLQKRFFTSVFERYQGRFDDAVLLRICRVINAGIGLSSGEVVMGDLGPKNGVRKFGILGDPMNLTSRIESLTRCFNTEIIITGEFLAAAESLQYGVRRLGNMCVKGRSAPEILYAVGYLNDFRFGIEELRAWNDWLRDLEQGREAGSNCPEIFAKDKATLLQWQARGLLDPSGVWRLDEK
ncbi:MAG: adenylate/guanylate cyclase domain-containing protein [Methylomicrobium sp.]